MSVLELDRTLVRKLEAMHVRIAVPDADTVVFHNVPVNRGFFSKPSTNLLIKRPSRDMPFVVGVDEDLDYTGQDPSLTRVFGGGLRRSGWRTLHLGHGPERNFQMVVEDALAALGYEGQEPSLPSPEARDARERGAGFLSAFGTNLSKLAREGRQEPTVDREEEIDEVASCLLRWGQAKLAVVIGESGVGKTNLLHAVAGRLSQRRPELDFVCIDLVGPLAGALFEAELEGILARLLDQAAASDRTILALEHIELAAKVPHGTLLLSQYLDKGRAMVGTMLPVHLPRLQRHPLARRLHAVELAALTAADTVRVLAGLRERIAGHQQVEIDGSLLPACVKAAEQLEGPFPAKAIAVLDAAAARAALGGARLIAMDDVYFAAQSLARGMGWETE